MTAPAFIFFDLDGVLVDSEPHHDKAERAIYTEVSGGRRTGPGFDTTGTSTRALYATLVRELGLPHDVDALNARHYDETFRNIVAAKEPPMPGLLPLLDALDLSRIPYAVVSSSYRSYVENVLRYLEIGGRFRFAVCGDEAARVKPAPDLYERALALTNVSAAHTVAIEDRRAGIDAANAAGIRTIGLDRRVGQDLSAADATVSALNGVPRLLGIG